MTGTNTRPSLIGCVVRLQQHSDMAGKSIVIHASELAACIGKNRFKSQQEMVALFLERLGLTSARHQYIEKKNLPPPQAAEAARAASALRTSAASSINLDSAKSALLATVISVIEGDERRADQVIQGAKGAVEDFEDEQQGQQGQQGVTDGMSGFIVSESQRTETTLGELVSFGVVTVHQAEMMKNEYVSRLSKSYGRACEEDVVDRLCRERGWRIDRSSHDTYRKRFVMRTDQGVDVYVGGKIDGYLCNPQNGQRTAILEVKNRVSRLFRRVYDYERVQVLAYMYINDMTESPGVLVERHGRSDIMAHVVPYDAAYWHDTVIPGINGFLQQLHDASHQNDA